MDFTSILLKILFQAIGVILILAGFYLVVKSYPFSNIHTYSYISERERRKRSIKASVGAMILIFGIFSIVVAGNSQRINLDSVLSILAIGLCLLPIFAATMFFRTYRDLQMFTKAEDDVVFVDKKSD